MGIEAQLICGEQKSNNKTSVSILKKVLALVLLCDKNNTFGVNVITRREISGNPLKHKINAAFQNPAANKKINEFSEADCFVAIMSILLI